MKKRETLIYRIITAIFTVFIGMGATMYFVQHDMVVEMFTSLGYPTYIIYPLATAKILGLVAIWTNKSKMLKEWAYAGFIFELSLAIAAHVNLGDGEFGAALVALLLVVTSYVYNRKVYAVELS